MSLQQKILATLKEFEHLQIAQQIDYDKFYLYSLITHSTAIEGSTVTEVENQLLFDEGIPAKGKPMEQQLMNLDLKAAYEHSLKLAKQKEDLSIETLKFLAGLVMKNTGSVYNTILGNFSSAQGDLRLVNVTAGSGGKSYLNHAQVPQKLLELCNNINQRRKSIDPNNIIECYNLSFDLHFWLVTIHPWVDGNGRMSRLVMNQIQFELGLIPTIINKNIKADYIDALIATRQSNDINIFREFMTKHHIKNLEQMILEHKQSKNSDLTINVPVNVPVNVPINLSERKQHIIAAMQSNNAITATQLSQMLGVSDKTIKRNIASLKEQGIVVRIGSNKGGSWLVNIVK